MAYNSIEKAVLSTCIYGDIFNFPLSKEELWAFLISTKKIERESFEHALQTLCGQVLHQEDGFYCLKGKEKSILKRKVNLPEVRRKLLLAKKAAYYLSYIPTIYFIGISGGVSVGNVAKQDDIDLFIIAKKKTLFITRLWILALLELLDMRRKRHASGEGAQDKICVNLLIDESSLSWFGRRRDIYIAREIMQAKPLFERNGMYRKFLSANQWARSFLLNAKAQSVPHRWNNNYHTIRFLWVIFASRPLEFLARVLQKHSIKKHQTTEVVSNATLAFHPHDYRKETLGLLGKSLKRFGILTNM